MQSTNDHRITGNPDAWFQSSHDRGRSPDAAPSLISVVADPCRPRTCNCARLLQRLTLFRQATSVTVLAGGAFAKYVEFARHYRSISAEDAGRVTSGQVAEIARYLEQSDPIVLEQVVVALSHDPTAMAALGASVAAIAVKVASARLRRAPSVIFASTPRASPVATSRAHSATDDRRGDGQAASDTSDPFP